MLGQEPRLEDPFSGSVILHMYYSEALINLGNLVLPGVLGVVLGATGQASPQRVVARKMLKCCVNKAARVRHGAQKMRDRRAGGPLAGPACSGPVVSSSNVKESGI